MTLKLRFARAAVLGVLIMMNSPIGLADSFKAGVVAYDNGLYEEAARIWSRVANRTKDPAAQYNLGLLYEQGLGVDEHSGVAARYYLAAARQDYAAAQYNLAGLYHRGDSVVQNDREAVYWWSKAAQQGYADAQHALAVLLLKGDTVPANREHAMQWLKLAAGNGHAGAADLLARLEQARLDSIDLAPPGTADSRAAGVYSDIDWIQHRSADNFTVQLHETDTARQAKVFIINHGISDVATYYRRGNHYAVIGGEYEKREHAEAAIANLSQALRSLEPQVRKYAAVHQELAGGKPK